ncbi:MAG: glycosyltransferase family 4 protein [Actinobacteria bacterium]|nr:glycosyltransferase family 4 protein [Actinomycetota bacterium]
MIGISLLTLVPGELGGTETYVRGLTHALAEEGGEHLRVFLPPIAPEAGGGLDTVVVPEYRTARTTPERLRAMAAAAVRPGPIRRHFAALAAVHYPLTIALPEPGGPRPFAVTLHDLLHLDRPELFPRAEAALRRLTYDRSARRSALVIVPSGFVRDRGVELLGIAPERIRLIPHGIDHDRFRPGPGPEPREPFLLYPARPWPHKNHARLFEAFRLVRRERPELRLVLTGGGHEGRPVPPGVEVRGLVPHEELVSLLQRAVALVFPSLYEGFGAPPLEAMACGCPVAASRAASLPETCGDAAVLFDATAPEDIARATLAAIDRAEELSARGLERAARFTWAESARAHRAVYDELEGLASSRS